jgi:hypothetical protein
MSLDGGLRKMRRRLLIAGAPLLLLSLLPTLLFVGHWSQLAGGFTGEDWVVNEEDHDAHEAHCHTAFAGCGDQPAPPGLQGFAAVVDLPEDGSVTIAIDEWAQVLEGLTVVPPTEPPRTRAV